MRARYPVWMTFAVLAASMALALGITVPQSASGASQATFHSTSYSVFSAHLTGDAVVPGVDTSVKADAVFVLSDTLYYRVKTTGGASLRLAEIYAGQPGYNGTLVATLFDFTDGTVQFDDEHPLAGAYELSAGEETLLEANGLYMVLKTAAYQDGEVRGQIVGAEVPHGFMADLSGDNEVPPVDTSATGHFSSTLEEDGTTLRYELSVSDLEGAIAAHIHRGAAGQNGPPEVWLYDVTGMNGPGGEFDSSHPISGTLTLSAMQLADLMAGLGYANVHTTAHTSGEIRGQLSQTTLEPTPTATAGTAEPSGTPSGTVEPTQTATATTPTNTPAPTDTPDPNGRVVFEADMSGSFEVPPVEGTAVARALFVLDNATGQLHYRIDVSGLEPPTAAHIHAGVRGANGPPILWLYDASGVNAPGGTVDETHPISGTVQAGAAVIAAMSSGAAYTNIHTAAHPGGEIRGQVAAYAGTMAFVTALSGANEVPPVDTQGGGTARLRVSGDFKRLHAVVNVEAITSTMQAHLHRGLPGENGPPVVWLYDSTGVQAPGGPFDPEHPLDVEVDLTSNALLDLLAGGMYLNVHTAAHMSGEIRGQVGGVSIPVPPPNTRVNAVLRAHLTGAAEVPPVNTSAEGRAVFVLGEVSTGRLHQTGEFRLSFRVDVTGLENITMAHLHRGQPTESGPPVLWLYDASGEHAPGGMFGDDDPLRGSVAIPADLVADLLAGGLYINVHTDAHPGGEIRGQVEAFEPDAHMVAELNGDQMTPVVDTDAEGRLDLDLAIDARPEIAYSLSATDLAAALAAHIHLGLPGESGPVVAWLYDQTGASGPGGDLSGGDEITGTVALSDLELADLLAGALYADVHTIAHVAGEIRGQIVAAPEVAAFELALPYIEGIRGAIASVLGALPDAIGGAGETGIQIQNLSRTENANVTADFYTPSGTLASSMSSVIEPEAAGNIWVPGTSLPSGKYAGLVRSSQPAGAIVRTDWPATGAAAIYSDVEPGRDVSLPLFVRQYLGHSSIVTVQNTEQRAISVTLTVSEVGEATPAMTVTLQLNAHGSMVMDADAEMATLGDRFIGALRAQADGDVALQTFIDIATSEKAVYAFEGVPVDTASTRLYAPLFRAKQYPRGGDPTSGRLDTGISVVNPGAGTATVTITYRGSNDRAASIACRGQTFTSPTVPIAPGSSHVFYQGDPAAQNLPEDCFGSAEINSDQPVLAIVNDSLNEGTTAAAYNAVAGGAQRVALPLYRREHVGLSTGIQAMNVGSQAAQVTITFVRQNPDGSTTPVTGCGDWCNVTIEPGEAHTWWPPNQPALAPGSFGAAVIESTQPLAVIVNDAEVIGARDMATYNGLAIGQ